MKIDFTGGLITITIDPREVSEFLDLLKTLKGEKNMPCADLCGRCKKPFKHCHEPGYMCVPQFFFKDHIQICADCHKELRLQATKETG